MATPKKPLTATFETLNVAEPIKRFMQPGSYPDAKTEFIAELAGLIAKWRGIPGKDADNFAGAYERILCELLTPGE